MILILIGLAIGAAVVANGTVLFVPAVVNAVLAFWSNGVLANYRGGPPELAPNWAATVSLLAALLSVGFIVGGLLIG